MARKWTFYTFVKDSCGNTLFCHQSSSPETGYPKRTEAPNRNDHVEGYGFMLPYFGALCFVREGKGKNESQRFPPLSLAWPDGCRNDQLTPVTNESFMNVFGYVCVWVVEGGRERWQEVEWMATGCWRVRAESIKASWCDRFITFFWLHCFCFSFVFCFLCGESGLRERKIWI